MLYAYADDVYGMVHRDGVSLTLSGNRVSYRGV